MKEITIVEIFGHMYNKEDVINALSSVPKFYQNGPTTGVQGQSQDQHKWYSIDDDGHPTVNGQYDVLYDGESEDEFYGHRRFFRDGTWVHSDGCHTEFGNHCTQGERYRLYMAD